MVTLTLPHIEVDGKMFKTLLDGFLVLLQREYQATPEWSALWFLEFQKRGSPHAHVLLTSRAEKSWVSRTWAGLWSRRVAEVECTGVLEARERMRAASTRVEKLRVPATRYAAKYGSKMEQKEVPEDYHGVGRFWGVRGLRKLLEPDIRLVELPEVHGKTIWTSRLISFWLGLEKAVVSTRGIKACNWPTGTGVHVFGDRDSDEFKLLCLNAFLLLRDLFPGAQVAAVMPPDEAGAALWELFG
jgi:hypothetical protein